MTMAVQISGFSISGFRGIQGLEVNNLNHINVIVGDNNCGKTSVLEALLLLRDPSNMVNTIRVARVRETSRIYSVSNYESFIDLFSKTSNNLCINVSAAGNKKEINYELKGECCRIIVDPKELEKSSYSILFGKEKPIKEKEANAFRGQLISSINNTTHEEPVLYHEYTRITGMAITRKDVLRIRYLAPYDHIQGRVIDEVISNEEYKKLCVHILQLFDPNITDLLILKDTVSERYLEYIKHQHLGNMPVSTYGDGIKKVLSLANAIAKATNGVLLIDEIETAIHSKYYQEIFSFVVLACLQFNVQLFVTTHSIEALDAILKTQDYSNHPAEEKISVITLRKSSNKTLSRVMPGRQVEMNREAFGFEVRI